MFDSASQTWHIFRLDRSSETWSDTGVAIDDRPNTLADVLWDGTHLYVASPRRDDLHHDRSRRLGCRRPRPGCTGTAISADRGYTLDQGFPVAIFGQPASESLDH